MWQAKDSATRCDRKLIQKSSLDSFRQPNAIRRKVKRAPRSPHLSGPVARRPLDSSAIPISMSEGPFSRSPTLCWRHHMQVTGTKLALLTLLLAITPFLRASAADAPDKLSSILVPGEDWKIVAEGFG